jgi:hypothetical protein
MKALERAVAAAVVLAALTVLPAGGAHASPPQVDQGKVGRQHATQPRHEATSRCNSGHGAQVDCVDTGRPSPDPATTVAAARGSRLLRIRSMAALGLLVALAAGGGWLQRRHRPREAD